MRIPRGLFVHGLLVLFLLSGFAGLVYQSIWSHYLGLLLGHAAYAQALVLATFMGGMAAGAALVSRYGSRWRNLVRGYAGVELALGVAGVGFHALFIGSHGFLLDTLLPLVPDNAFAADLLRWSAGIGLILPQTLLLGASFPLLGAGIMRRVHGRDGRVLGNLYFSNSIGAALGALAATFVLLPQVGLPGAVQFAGWLNLMIGLAAWMLASDPRGEGALPRRPRRTDAGVLDAALRRRSLLIALLAATALSSAASFVYEIGWIRMLTLAVGGTLHAFELMLAAFIGGLALGGLWIRGRADHFARPLIALGWIQLLMGLCALVSLAIYAQGAFAWVGFLVDALAPSDTGYGLYNLGTATAAVVLMLPAAFFAGATLPLFTTILLRAGHGEAVIGRVYACNAVGAIVGVMAAVHLLLPILGLRDAMIIAAGVDMALGVAIMCLHGTPAPRRIATRAATVVAAAGIAAAVGLVHFDPHRLASGVFRSGQAVLPADRTMRFYRDGKTASVSVHDSPGGLRSIAHNGKIDASIAHGPGTGPSSDEPTMVLAGALPLALHPRPQRAAVIGLGSGLTTHMLLADPRLRRVDTIEIEAMMAAGAREFGERVERVWSDPRSTVIIDDARAVLARGAQHYDIIVSEPSNPWMAGVGTLFAAEFYDFISRRLDDRGLFVQWLQLYEIDDALVGSVIAALTPHFGDFRAWMSNNADLLIVATPAERLPELRPQVLFQGDRGAEMARAGLHHPAQLGLREVADGPILRSLDRVLAQPANSWYRPVLMLEAPRTRYRGIHADRLIRLATLRSMPLELLGAGAPPPLDAGLPDHPHYQGEATAHNARALRQLLRGERSPGALALSTQVVRDAELLRLWSRDCAALDDPGRVPAWLRVYGELAARHLPLLDAAAAEGAFRNPRWLQCEQVPYGIHAAIEVVAALAARDHERIPQAAARYLDVAGQPDLAGSALNELAYLSAQASLLAQGDVAGAQSFQFRYLGAVRLGEQGWLMQDMLEQYRLHETQS